MGTGGSLETIDCVVIGAGVIGLAVARAMAQAGREVIVLEAERFIGTGTSARNSEVIHAGIYYSQNSLKATLCIAGRKALYAYCISNHVPHRRCGKLIVATQPQQFVLLHTIREKAIANGVTDIQLLTAEQVSQIEPQVYCLGALMSPSTGIIDSHAYMLALRADAENAGAVFVFGAPVLSGQVTSDGLILTVGGNEGSESSSWQASTVINCAGLYAQEVALSLKGFPASHVPPSYYAKGNYFSLSGSPKFNHLIYPVPEVAGLGIHLTFDIAGQARFGPDIEWISEPAYSVDPTRSANFYAAIREYWPALPSGVLHPDYAGVRPKLSGPGDRAEDFRIDGPQTHGVPGLVNLFGIESPGLTASLAIADLVVTMAG